MQAGPSTGSVPPPRLRVTRNGQLNQSNTLSDDRFPSDLLRESVQLGETSAPFGEHVTGDFSSWYGGGKQRGGAQESDSDASDSHGEEPHPFTPGGRLDNFSSATPTPNVPFPASTQTQASRLRSLITRLPPEPSASKLSLHSEAESDDLYSRALPRISPKESTRETMSRIMHQGLDQTSSHSESEREADFPTQAEPSSSFTRPRADSFEEPGSPRISPRRRSISDDEREIARASHAAQSNVSQSRSKASQINLLLARLESADLDHSLPPSVASETPPPSDPPTPRLAVQSEIPASNVEFPTQPRSRSPSPLPGVRRSRTSTGAGHAADSLSLLASRISTYSDYSADEGDNRHLSPGDVRRSSSTIIKTKADIEKERERDWNRRNRRSDAENRNSLPTTPHHSHVHSRTQSHPSPPPSSIKPLSPPSPAHSNRSASPMYFQRSHSRQSALDDSGSSLVIDRAQWEKGRERNWNSPRPKPLPHSPSVSPPMTIRRKDSMESLGSAPRDAHSPSFSMFGRRKRIDSTSSVASTSSAVEASPSAPAIAPASRHGKEKPPGASLLSMSSSRLLQAFRPSSPATGTTAASHSTSPLPSATSTRVRTLSTPATVSKEKEKEKETHWNMPIHARARSTHTTTPETSPKKSSASSAKGVATSLLHRAQSFGSPSKKKDKEREREASENSSLHEPGRSVSPSPTQASSSTGGSLAPVPYGEGFPRERKRSQTNSGTPSTSISRGSSFRESIKKVFKRSSKESFGSGDEPRPSSPSSTPSWMKGGGERDSGSNSSAELPAPDPVQPPGLAEREGPTMSESEVERMDDTRAEDTDDGAVVDLTSSLPPSPLDAPPQPQQRPSGHGRSTSIRFAPESRGDERRNSLSSIPRLVSPTTTPQTSPAKPPSTTPTTTPSRRASSTPSRIPRAPRVVDPNELDLNSSDEDGRSGADEPPRTPLLAAAPAMPDTPPEDSSLVTPPRQRSFQQWKTPSPPPGGLPDLPSDSELEIVAGPDTETETELEEIPEEGEVGETLHQVDERLEEESRNVLSTPSHANGNGRSLLPAKTPKFPGAWKTPAATPAPATLGSAVPTTPFTPSAGPSRSSGLPSTYETPAETPVPEPSSGVPSVYETPAETPKVSVYQTPAETPKTSVYQTPAETPKTSVYQTPAETPKPSVHQLPAETPVSRPDGKAPKTPAPPGGWMATPHGPTPAQGAWPSAPQTPSIGPSSLKRNDSNKKVSRVRFDRSPSTSSIVSAGSGSDREMDGVPMALKATVITTVHDLLMPRFATGQPRDSQQRPQSSQQQQQHQNGGSEQKRLPDKREQTPYRPPRVNVVDAFGRDMYAEDGAPIKRLDEPETKPLEPLVLARPLPAPVQATNGSSKSNGAASKDENDSLAGISARRREKMRVDDVQPTFGERAVEITIPGDETPKPLDTNAVIEFMRDGLSKLENDTADESSSGPLAAAQPLTLSELLEREERIKELKIQSESSRIERGKITRQSQLARTNSVTSAEKVDQLRSKSSSGKHGHRSRSSTKSGAGSSASSAVKSGTAPAAQKSSWRPYYMLALIQLVVLYLAMEWAEYRAEYLFLTTHFDATFPILEDTRGFPWYFLPFPPSTFATPWDYYHPGAERNFVEYSVSRFIRFMRDMLYPDAMWEVPLRPIPR